MVVILLIGVPSDAVWVVVGDVVEVAEGIVTFPVPGVVPEFWML